MTEKELTRIKDEIENFIIYRCGSDRNEKEILMRSLEEYVGHDLMERLEK